MYLVGFVIRIYHDARSPKQQTGYSCVDFAWVLSWRVQVNILLIQILW